MHENGTDLTCRREKFGVVCGIWMSTGAAGRLVLSMSGHGLIHESLTGSVIGAFYEVYNILEFGFLEHIYSRALEEELRLRGHDVGREVSVRIMYKGQEIGFQRLDFIVDDTLLVEVKASFDLPLIATRQLFNYLRATNLEVGLLLHFGPRPAFHRTVHCKERSGSFGQIRQFP